MRISDEALDEFIRIYREEFGEEIDRVEATEMAHRLLALALLPRPPASNAEITPSDYDRSRQTSPSAA